MGWVRYRALFAWCLALGVGGCGDDGPDEPSPAEWCTQFVGTYCNNYAGCFPPSDHARQVEDCQFSWQLSLDCSQVVALGLTHNVCVRDVSSMTCTEYLDPDGGIPSSCSGVLLTQ